MQYSGYPDDVLIQMYGMLTGLGGSANWPITQPCRLARLHAESNWPSGSASTAWATIMSLQLADYPQPIGYDWV